VEGGEQVQGQERKKESEGSRGERVNSLFRCLSLSSPLSLEYSSVKKRDRKPVFIKVSDGDASSGQFSKSERNRKTKKSLTKIPTKNREKSHF
jgi:hypothetical protein